MKSFRTAITLVVALLVAGAAFAQSRGAGRIAGKVLDEAGQPVENVVVKAQKKGEAEIFEGKTNKKGEWAIGRVASGEWSLEFTKEGLAPSQMVTEVNENDRGNMLSVTMKKPAVAVDPNVAINQELQRAQELLKTNDTAGARTIYLALMEKHPQVYQFPYFIATTYAAEKNSAKALEYVNIAAEKAPESVEVKLLKAEIMMDAGDKAGAKALLDGVDMTQVKDPFVFVNSAINMINDGQGVEAVALLDRVIAQFPTNHMLYYYRGRANLASQKLDEAKADLEKFVSMAPADTREVADAKKILEQMVKK